MSSFVMKTPPSDGEILDDWEQMADSGLLDKKFQSIKTRIPDEMPATEIQSSHFLFNGDGSMKPTLLGPPPQIKILKRPQHNGSRGNHGNSNENGQVKPRYQLKTLQQKEAEYAEARLRILGEAAPTTTPSQDTSLSRLQNRMENLRTDDTSGCGILRLPRGPDGTRGFAQQN